MTTKTGTVLESGTYKKVGNQLVLDTDTMVVKDAHGQPIPVQSDVTSQGNAAGNMRGAFCSSGDGIYSCAAKHLALTISVKNKTLVLRNPEELSGEMTFRLSATPLKAEGETRCDGIDNNYNGVVDEGCHSLGANGTQP